MTAKINIVQDAMNMADVLSSRESALSYGMPAYAQAQAAAALRSQRDGAPSLDVSAVSGSASPSENEIY